MVRALHAFDRAILAQMEHRKIRLHPAIFGGNDRSREVGDILVAIHVGARGNDVQGLAVGQAVHMDVGEQVERVA